MSTDSNSRPEAIAVVGAACRFPGADDLNEFWNNLVDGVVSIQNFTDQQVLQAGLSPEKLRDPNWVKAGAVIDGMECFDASFFGVNPSEARLLDPQHRLLLETTWSALENAGYDPDRYPGSIGVFAGTNFPSYMTANLIPADKFKHAADLISLVLANDKDYLTSRVSHKLNLRGPSITVQSGCSTSLLAIHLASQSLLNLECDLALAGGVSVEVLRGRGYAFVEGGVASPNGTCRPFDADANGTVFGNGVGVVVLKRLSDALAERDNIRAVLIGSAVNNDGANKPGFTTPSVSGQYQVISEAMSHADVSPDDLDFVETHGTGTFIGDPIEIRALQMAFDQCRSDGGQGRCAIGSVKSNVGHLDCAAGVAGFLKVVLSLQNRRLVPSPGFERANPAIDFDGSRFYVNRQALQWAQPTSGNPRRAGVSSFGLGGTNVHAIVEEPPQVDSRSKQPRDWQLLVLSARSASALMKRAHDLATHLREADDSLADVAFTLQVGRAEFGMRCFLVCRDRYDAAQQLDRYAAEVPKNASTVATPTQLVFDISDASKDLSSDFRMHLRSTEPFFAEVDDQVASCLAAQVITTGVRHQIEWFRFCYAYARLWQKWGIRPAACRAVGVGKLVAACVQNECSVADAARCLLDTSSPARFPYTVSAPTAAEKLKADTPTLFLRLGPGIGRDLDVDRAATTASETLDCLPPGPAAGDLTETMLRALGAIWMRGESIDWSAFQQARFPSRVELPTYPFERKRFWVDSKQPPAKPADDAWGNVPASNHSASTKLTRQSSDRWLYKPIWQPATPVEPAGSWASDTCWLVLEDSAGVAAQLIQCLAATYPSHRFVRVMASPSCQSHSSSQFEIDPGDRESYLRLAQQVRQTLGRLPDVVVHAWAIDNPSGRFCDFFSVLWFIQAWQASQGGPLNLKVITRPLDPVTSTPEASALLGPCQVLPQEQAGSSCQIVEVALPDGTVPHQSVASLSASIVSELLSRRPLPRVRLQGATRTVVGYQRLPVSAAAPTVIRKRGVYLITGGLGRIGLTLGMHLAQTHNARVALVTKSRFPARHQWQNWLDHHDEHDSTSKKLRRLIEIPQQQLQVHSADVCDFAQLEGVVQAVRENFGTLNGVVHAAGSVDEDAFGRLSELTVENCERQLLAKADAVAALQQLAEANPLDFCLVVSSLSTVLGGYGYGAYAGAHHLLNALTERRHGKGCPWLCVNWDAWTDSRLPRHESSGPSDSTLFALSLSDQENTKVFDRLLQTPLAPHIVVSSADIEARLAACARPRPRRLSPQMTADVAPTWKTPLQGVVAGMWSDLLGSGPTSDQEDFFDLGGDSLAAMQLVARMQDVFLIPITVQDVFAHRTIEALASRIRAIQQTQTSDSHQAIPHLQRHARTRFPLSFAQQRLWFLNQLEPESAAYHLPIAIELEGSLDMPALGESIQRIGRRHEVLRTRIAIIEGNLGQVIEDEVQIPITLETLQDDVDRQGQDSELLIHDWLLRSIGQPFDLGRTSLLRCNVLRLSSRRHVLLLVMHHLIGDSWSLDLLTGELMAHYNALSSGRTPELAEVPVQYADWAAWQRARDDQLQQQRDYWTRQLHDLTELRLPVETERRWQQTFDGQAVTIEFPMSFTDDLESLSRAEDATLFMSLLAGIQVLLREYSGSDDIVVGAPVSSRSTPELEGLIGCFLNTLVLRGDLSGSPTFRELLRRARTIVVEAMANQETPFETVVKLLQPDRDLSVNPLFQVLFSMQAAPEPLEFNSLRARLLDFGSISTRFDLEFHAQIRNRRILVTAIYNAGLFSQDTITDMLQRLEDLLLHMVTEPDSAIPTTAFRDATAATTLPRSTSLSPPAAQPASLHDLFAAQARDHPHAIAVIAPDRQLTYRQLDQVACQLQRELMDRGARRGDLVGVSLPRSWQWIASLLGILKAGCAFLPLDPDWPQSRRAMILKDSAARFLLRFNGAMESQIGTIEHVIDGDRVFCATSSDSDRDLPSWSTTADDLAYVVTTSGSTGVPKGVAVSHLAIVGHLAAMQAQCGFCSSDAWSALTPATFDISLLEVFLPLTLGGRVVIGSDRELAEPGGIMTFLNHHDITVVQTTPTRWRTLLDCGYQPRRNVKILCGGEELAPPLARDLLATGCEVWNLYGPTEATVWATASQLIPNVANAVTLGKPLQNTTAYVLDERLQRLPVGSVGELYLGGTCLARCYHNDAKMTAEKFIPNPFAVEGGSRMYRTGDLACWTADGRLRFKGRSDDQVKVRGHRIHLVEIEAALGQLAEIRDAVVAVDQTSEQRLVAFVISAATQPFDEAVTKRLLAERLPLAMIPSAIRAVAQFPITAHGKVDRAALLSSVPPRQRDGSPASASIEGQIAEIWCRLLDLESVDVDANFFDAGGHSMLLVQLQYELSKRFGLDIAMIDLFRFPTIADMATRVAVGEMTSPAADELTRRAGQRKAALQQRQASISTRPGQGGEV